MYKVGVDVGGTKIEAVLLDDLLEPIQRKRISTPKDNYEQILDTISYLVGEITANISDFSVGVCAPGTTSRISNLVINSNTVCLIGKPLRQDLENKLGRQVALDNDANCFAVAEATMGSAKGYRVVFGVIMGTGVGGGIVIDGKPHHGRMNIAGEWGHHTLHPCGNACYCGRVGCAETYLSGPALEKKWSKVTNRHQPMLEIVQNLNNPAGRRFKANWLKDFGMGISNVIDILDPDAIVLGGGLSNVDFLYTEGKKSVYENVFSDFVDTPILKNHLGDSAGVFGAALLH